VKVPTFSFEKLADVDTHLGPEMKSTGEVLGVGRTLEEALFKGLIGAGYKMRKTGGLLLTVRDSDKREAAETARKFAALGYSLYATPGTCKALLDAGLNAAEVKREDTATILEQGYVHIVISTSSKGRFPTKTSVKLRRKAVERAIPVFTSMDTANALANSLASRYTQESMELVDMNHMRKTREKLHFIKMRATGNDYIYFDCFEQEILSPESLSVRVSSRRKGIGGDGIVLILPSDKADAKMRMFNADGSEGQVAGNAMRCVGKYLYESGRVHKDSITLETGGGIKALQLYVREDMVYSACVKMGQPDYTPWRVPVLLENEVIRRKVTLAGGEWEITCLSMGNPHCVIFVPDVDQIDLEVIGPAMENDPLFPQRVNISFAQVIDRNTLKMRVWERGIGETWACGTGACAVAAAAVRCGLADRDTDISLRLIGGELVIRCDEDGISMTGDAQKDFEGDIEI
jgi:carbamoyl-phosphate synthase large subunit